MYVRMLFAYYYCVLRAIARGGISTSRSPSPGTRFWELRTTGVSSYWYSGQNKSFNVCQAYYFGVCGPIPSRPVLNHKGFPPLWFKRASDGVKKGGPKI